MKNRKALVMPMVIVLMLMSQLMYLSIAYYNQGQSRRYQQFIHYYEGQIQLALSRALFVPDQVSRLIENEITSKVTQQTNFLLGNYQVESQINFDHGLKVLSLIDPKQEAWVGILYPMVYLDKREDQRGQPILFDGLEIQGWVQAGKLPQDDETSELRDQLLQVQDQLVNRHYQLIQQSQRSTQAMVELKRDQDPIVTFDNGNRLFKKKLGDKHLIQVLNQAGQVVTQEKILVESVYYFVRTRLELYKLSDNGSP